MTYGMIQGIGQYEFGAEGCFDDSSSSLSSDDNVEDFGKAPRKMQRPATADDAVGELFTYVDLENDAEIALYIECRGLEVEVAVLPVILLAYEPDFNDAVGTWEELLAEISTGDDSGATDDMSDEIGKTSKKRGDDGPTYINASAGFTATLDDEVWSVRKTKDDEGLGIGIEVETDTSIGWITGDPYTGALETCASDFAEGVGTYETINKMRESSSTYDAPATSRDAIGGLYTYTDVTGDPVKMVAYFECRPAAEQDHVVTVLLAAPKEFDEDELPLWEDLLGGIEVDDTGDKNDRTSNEESMKGDDKKDKSDKIEPVAVDGVTVADAKYGFELTYDDSVWAVDDLSDENNDFLDLISELAIGSVIAFNMPYDGATSLQTLAELKQGDGVTNFDVVPDAMERPKTNRAADGELFVYTFEGQNGPVDAVTYIGCRSLESGSATLGVIATTVPVVYEDALPAFETLLAGINTGTRA